MNYALVNMIISIGAVFLVPLFVYVIRNEVRQGNAELRRELMERLVEYNAVQREKYAESNQIHVDTNRRLLLLEEFYKAINGRMDQFQFSLRALIDRAENSAGD